MRTHTGTQTFVENPMTFSGRQRTSIFSPEHSFFRLVTLKMRRKTWTAAPLIKTRKDRNLQWKLCRFKPLRLPPWQSCRRRLVRRALLIGQRLFH